MKLFITYILLFSSLFLAAQSTNDTSNSKRESTTVTDTNVDNKETKTKIEILGSDELVYNQSQGRFQICRGNVRFKQGAMLMDCDSARFYEGVNRIEAFGNIYIRQKDTVDLWGGYLEYDGDTRLAMLSKDVRLTDGEMNLTTDQLNYDMAQKIGYYSTGGNIVNEDDKLYSVKGTYYSRSKEFYFKDSVSLTNPEYRMESDTLSYNTQTKVATFYGPTYIYSEENTIYCEYGWYNTDTEKSQFSRGAYIEGKDNRLRSDSMVYNRNSGLGEAFGNIELIDTIEEITVTGSYGEYKRFEKSTLITGDPLAIKKLDGELLFLKADSFLDLSDTLGVRKMVAYRNVKMFKEDVQAVADSMEYNFTDSTIAFYTDPVLWNDSNQITGDTIFIFRNGSGLEKIRAFQNAFMTEKDPNELYNQIAGKTLTAHFIEGKIDKVYVQGNGQSVYYAKEDSTTYSGVNSVVCGEMIINIDTFNKVRTITFLQKPKASFYPLEKFPASKSRISGFSWRNIIRPKIAMFLK